MAIPDSMRAVQLLAYDGKPESIAVAEIPVPRPGSDEVLVRVFASTINPSDLMFIRGLYGFKKPLPAVPGFEGSGTVVEAGTGLMSRFLKGRRVACAAADPKVTGGMWAEYVVTLAQLCVPLRKYVDLEQGAALLINPMTAWGLMWRWRSGQGREKFRSFASRSLPKVCGP
jgi:NADPH:quinone reductase-like Zn-dependent oxidoreductase